MPIKDAFAANVFSDDRSIVVPSLKRRNLTWKESLKNKIAESWSKFVEDAKQQRLAGSAPQPNPIFVITVVFATGVIFIPIGCVLLHASNAIREFKYEYHNRTYSASEVEFELKEDFAGKVVMFYEIDNFVQAHRLHMRTIPFQQMQGDLKNTEGCTEYKFQEMNIKVNKDIVPCALTFKSMFYDKFTLTRIDRGKQVEIEINRNDPNLLHPSDRRFIQDVELPPGTTLCEYMKELNLNNSAGPYTFCKHGFRYPPYVIWMKSAAFSSFRKPYAVVNSGGNGLMKGRYKMEIERNFEPATLRTVDPETNETIHYIHIRFVFSTLSWMGGKNPFLGRIYITVGLICVLTGLVITFSHIKFRIPPEHFSFTFDE